MTPLATSRSIPVESAVTTSFSLSNSLGGLPKSAFFAVRCVVWSIYFSKNEAADCGRLEDEKL